jgi:predicted cupin superfamily sugar epimerase
MSKAENETDKLIKRLELLPHPEGGYYREIYRSDLLISYPGYSNRRSACTDIYYLLKYPDFSSFHRLRSDELWHFYQGDSLLIHELTHQGVKSTRMSASGNAPVFRHIVKRNTWFAAEPENPNTFALVGCTMAPGFDFNDFEMAEKEKLMADFPDNAAIVNRLCR